MSKFRKKSAVLGLVTLLVVASITFLILWLTNQDNNKKSTSSPQAPVLTSEPNATVKEVYKYENKTIALVGTIQQLKDNSYVLVGEGKTPSAIKLDFSKSNIDPKTYANLDQATSNPENAKIANKGPFKVTGLVKTGPKAKSSVLEVSSIK